MTENIKSEVFKHLSQTLKIEQHDNKTKELHRLCEEIYEMILSKSLSYKESNTVLDCVKIVVNNTPLSLNDGQMLINALKRYVASH